MTAIAARRRRHTIVGATVAGLFVVLAATMFGVGVVTLVNSRAGQAVGVDDRPVETFPATPNALLAVQDDAGKLVSLVVMTLLPAGQGGSIVTVPVNADSTAGFGLDRTPLDGAFDASDLPSLVDSVEQMLSITVQRAQVVDAATLATLLPPIEAVQVVLPTDVVDTSSARGTDGIIVTAGPQTLTLAEAIGVIAAVDDDSPAYDAHANDVLIWEALARTAPTSSPGAVPLDALGLPVAPDDVAGLIDRLWQGEVGVRDIATAPLSPAENPTGADVVLLDRRDSTLIFAQVSPALMSTPNTGLKMRLVSGFTDAQLASTNGAYETNSAIAVEMIGKLLFFSGNIVSVDTAAAGAPEVTQILVSGEQWVQDSERVAPILFGEADVRIADTVLEGVDIQITLGTSYLTHLMNPTPNTESPGTVPDSTPAGTDVSLPAGTVTGDG